MLAAAVVHLLWEIAKTEGFRSAMFVAYLLEIDYMLYLVLCVFIRKGRAFCYGVLDIVRGEI